MRFIAPVISVIMLMAVSCISPHSAITADVNPLKWIAGEPAEVIFENGDSLAYYNLYIIIRYDRSVSLSALPLRIRTSTPDSLQIEEVSAAKLQVPDGSPDDLFETRTLYRSNVNFARKGQYYFSITPDAEQPVRGIRAVGMEFVKK